jgi:SAM-dependent methyltransferase
MANPRLWYESFFSGFILDAQRQMATEPQTRAEADFLVDVLQPRAGARFLDVPCGTGRLALALAARGLDVMGVDGCQELLEDGRRAAAAQDLPVRFERRDMRDLPWPGAFDHAFCFGNSFAYFDDAGNAAFLRAVHDVLRPDGTFALETHFVAETLFSQVRYRRWYPFGDLYFLHDTRYDPAAGTFTSTYILLRGGREEKKEAVYQVYLYRDLLALFRRAGFAEVRAFGSITKEPFQLGSPGLYLVARRE